MDNAWNSTLSRPKKPMRRTAFKRKVGLPLKKPQIGDRKPTSLPRKRGLRRVRPESVLTPSEAAKHRIQGHLRAFGIKRDGGCVFRDFPEMGECGGYTKDGALILQFDHLNSRTHSVSYADPRCGVCACLRHHFYFKKQYPDIYERCAMKAIGPERAVLVAKVRADKSPYKMDWVMEEIILKSELAKLQPPSPVWV